MEAATKTPLKYFYSHSPESNIIIKKHIQTMNFESENSPPLLGKLLNNDYIYISYTHECSQPVAFKDFRTPLEYFFSNSPFRKRMTTKYHLNSFNRMEITLNLHTQYGQYGHRHNTDTDGQIINIDVSMYKIIYLINYTHFISDVIESSSIDQFRPQSRVVRERVNFSGLMLCLQLREN